MSPEMKWLFNFQKQNAMKQQAFANSVPLSDPQELAALAQQRGLLGEEQRNAQQRVFSAMPQGAGDSNVGDLMANLSNEQVGQRAALTAQMLQQALESRRNALLQSSQIAQGAYAPAAAPRPQQPDVGGAIARFAQQYAYDRARKQGQGGGAGGGTGGGMYGQSGNTSPYTGGEPAGAAGGGAVGVPGGMAGVGIPPTPAGMGMYGATGTEQPSAQSVAGPMPGAGLQLNLPPWMRTPMPTGGMGGLTPGNSPFGPPAQQYGPFPLGRPRSGGPLQTTFG
jgi:hypothetical protein